MMPALVRTDRWWLTVAWLRSSGSIKSQAQISPSGTEAMMLSSRSRMGSASTLKSPANSSACGGESAWSVMGVQHDGVFTHPILHIDAHRCIAYASMSVGMRGDRKSTRLNSSHVKISYAVFCLKKKKI